MIFFDARLSDGGPKEWSSDQPRWLSLDGRRAGVGPAATSIRQTVSIIIFGRQ